MTSANFTMEEAHVPLLNSPVCVVDPQYCAPHPTNLAIVRKVVAMSNGNFVVTDVSNGSIIFKVKGKLWNFFHKHRVLLDAAGNPIITLRSKAWSLHKRWQVFKGKSTDPKDIIFSAKRSSVFQLKIRLHVFMANNTQEDICDFNVEGSWFLGSCAIYLGQSSTIAAQMRNKRSFESALIGKDRYMITVYPNVDFAFIVALIIIVHEINHDD